MRRLSILAAALALAAAPALAQPAPGASAELKNAAGETIGRATLSDSPFGVLMRLEARGLTPGWHGLHFHEKGDCSKADFTSAGGHTHGGTAARVHGLMNPKANESGDLPNLYVAADGTGAAEVFTGATSLRALMDADGTAVVIHAAPDDHMSQPIGGAGARVACGVVR
jgi:Cu-Zn family superoxide dismutase